MPTFLILAIGIPTLWLLAVLALAKIAGTNTTMTPAESAPIPVQQRIHYIMREHAELVLSDPPAAADPRYFAWSFLLPASMQTILTVIQPTEDYPLISIKHTLTGERVAVTQQFLEKYVTLDKRSRMS